MRLCSRVFFETTLYSNIFTPLYSKLSEISIQAGSMASRRTPIQALRSKRADPPQAPIHSLCLRSKHGKKNADPSTPIQAHRSATSADPLSLSPLVCLCVGVFGFVVSLGDFVVDFMVDFLFLWLIFYFICGSVCIRGRSRWWECWLCRWRRERKKGAKLKIITIMYRRATVTVHICTVIVAHGKF